MILRVHTSIKICLHTCYNESTVKHKKSNRILHFFKAFLIL